MLIAVYNTNIYVWNKYCKFRLEANIILSIVKKKKKNEMTLFRHFIRKQLFSSSIRKRAALE